MPITAVQYSTIAQTANSSASSVSMLLSSAVSSGDTIVVFTGSNGASGISTATVTDNVNAGNYSTVAIRQIGGVNTPGDFQTFYKSGVSSGAAASTYRVKIKFGGGTLTSYAACLAHYTGTSSNGALNASTGSTGTSSNAAAGPLTASSGSVVFCAGNMYGSSAGRSTMADGFTLETVSNRLGFPNVMLGDLITSSLTVGSTGSFHRAASTLWAGTILAFEASTAPVTASVNPYALTLTGVQVIAGAAMIWPIFHGRDITGTGTYADF